MLLTSDLHFNMSERQQGVDVYRSPSAPKRQKTVTVVAVQGFWLNGGSGLKVADPHSPPKRQLSVLSVQALMLKGNCGS